MSESFIFKWPILEFSKKAPRDGSTKTLRSDEFSVGEYKVYLDFYPVNTREDSSRDYCSLFLGIKGLDRPINLNYQLWIENNRGERIGLQHDSTRKFNTMGWGYPEFVSHDKLYPPESEFIKDDFVFVCCRIRCIDEEKKNILLERIDDKVHKIMFSMHQQGQSDECRMEVDGEQLNVSKSLLMAHSPVFNRMFSNEMDEKKGSLLKIEDASPEVIKALVKYLYLKEIDDLDSIALELFVLADKYNIQELASLCVKSLAKSMSKANIFERLKTAFMHGNGEFRQVVLDHVTVHKSCSNFRQILKWPEWKQLLNENEKLAEEIMDAVFNEISFLG